MENWTFYIETYGCKVNQYESQILREAWLKLGGEERNEPEKAQFIYINSCAVTGRAERDARNAVFRLRRRNPGARLILCGCAAQFFPDFKPRRNANWASPDVVIGQSEKARLLQGPWNLEKPAAKFENGEAGIENYWRARAVVKVQDGCSLNCAYCIVPQTRGKPSSRAPEAILAECRNLLRAGFSEIIISGVNLRQYRHPGTGGFWALMAFLDRELAPYAGKARLRISSLDPAQLTEEGIETLLGMSLCCPHLHLSLQHASQSILRNMGRGHYNAESILKAIDTLSGHWPVMGLGADILVGFPGETAADMEILLNFVDRARLTYAHVFPYSRRQGTPAANLPGQLSMKEKQARALEVRLKVDSLKLKFWKSLARLPHMRVVADNKGGNGTLRGVNEYYAPCLIKAESPRADLLSKYGGMLLVTPAGITERGIVAEICGNGE